MALCFELYNSIIIPSIKSRYLPNKVILSIYGSSPLWIRKIRVLGSQPKFYDTIQSHTMVAANGVLSQILTKLPGINDLSKLKVSAPVT